MVFTGKAQSPKEVADDAGVIAKVSGDLKAIGYVDSGSVNDSVKEVLKIPQSYDFPCFILSLDIFEI